MARYEDDRERRDYYDREGETQRNDRFGRERPWNFNEPLGGRRGFDDRSERFGGRFGERADYQENEPRYSGYSGRSRDEMNRGGYSREYESDYGREYQRGRHEEFSPSRLRCRDIMTRDLVVATRETPLTEVARMMKDEDTGVIPVVEYTGNGENGGTVAGERRQPGGSYSYGKLVGLITDRDIVVRAVAEDKDPRTTRAEEIMSTDILTAKPNDRLVDVLRRMADKQVRRIPVVSENGTLRGMISLGDIALETEADRELGDALEEISRKSSFWGRIFGS